jgi:hypothetical protein
MKNFIMKNNKNVLELFDYLNEIVLAHWILGDGAKKNKGLTLCTDSFTLKYFINKYVIFKI